ncbi:zinc finger CCCH domain-containing protein 15-like [Tubulanus polymorphus]|uniref:zinc finger CCCH domain-containing protein 15-like n=1 Tax=Tubulanus polymorphus TaxID=672921 RepID=UPI003DA6C374
MPPKPKASKPGKKVEEKKKEKVIEDKTFGLKNKKGTKQQKFIKTVTHQVKFGNQASKKVADLQNEKFKKKDDKKKEQEEMNTLFKPVQMVQKGADPKSIICAFFKQGQCKKGDKCKFSHDMAVERKAPKRNVYADDEKNVDSMDNWDEEQLNEVINKKHGEKNKAMPATTIICKYFLDAVENSKYGWFWSCPNGESCHYKHALPPGFVLKKDMKKEDKSEQISIEELIERERAALGGDTTKITLESFLKWKERKRKEKVAARNKDKEKKKSDFKQGRCLGISGREMFEFNPDLITGDDDEADEGTIEREPEEDQETEEGDDVVIREINIDDLSRLVTENDNSAGTQRNKRKNNDDELGKLDEAAAISNGGTSEAAIQAALSATVNGDVLAGDIPIDENLFEDLDALEDDLDTLDLDD